MNKDLKLKSINLKPLLNMFAKRFGGHIIFACVIAVLLVYILVVFKINTLSKAEPSPSQTISAPLIPKVNQKAVNQIQTLENNNAQLHTLFENARNNPFQDVNKANP
ncbi:MAG TPA: hypothetical protein VFW90_04340 [Candidatus Saccharimonadales bacterium]|nr:hypothetical protein [Candidatus Saccharimonadales bacterium]